MTLKPAPSEWHAQVVRAVEAEAPMLLSHYRSTFGCDPTPEIVFELAFRRSCGETLSSLLLAIGPLPEPEPPAPIVELPPAPAPPNARWPHRAVAVTGVVGRIINDLDVIAGWPLSDWKANGVTALQLRATEMTHTEYTCSLFDGDRYWDALRCVIAYAHENDMAVVLELLHDSLYLPIPQAELIDRFAEFLSSIETHTVIPLLTTDPSRDGFLLQQTVEFYDLLKRFHARFGKQYPAYPVGLWSHDHAREQIATIGTFANSVGVDVSLSASRMYVPWLEAARQASRARDIHGHMGVWAYNIPPSDDPEPAAAVMLASSILGMSCTALDSHPLEVWRLVHGLNTSEYSLDGFPLRGLPAVSCLDKVSGARFVVAYDEFLEPTSAQWAHGWMANLVYARRGVALWEARKL